MARVAADPGVGAAAKSSAESIMTRSRVRRCRVPEIIMIRAAVRMRRVTLERRIVWMDAAVTVLHGDESGVFSCCDVYGAIFCLGQPVNWLMVPNLAISAIRSRPLNCVPQYIPV